MPAVSDECLCPKTRQNDKQIIFIKIPQTGRKQDMQKGALMINNLLLWCQGRRGKI